MKKWNAIRSIKSILLLLAVYAVFTREILLSSVHVESYSLIEKIFRLAELVFVETTPASILTIAMVFLIHKKNLIIGNDGFSIAAFVTSGTLAAFRVLGISFSIDNSLNYIIQSKMQSMHALAVFGGYWYLLYALIHVAFKQIDTIQAIRKPIRSKTVCFIENHVFLVAFIAMLICWGSFWMLFFPGSLPHDGQNQLETFFGARAATQDHPYFVTLIMGWIVSLGKALHSYQAGIALYVGIQSVVCAAVYASECSNIHSKKAPLSLVMCSIVFFSVMPLFVSYAQSVIKDTLYIAFYVWFAMEYVKCFLNDGGERYSVIRITVAGLLCSLFRHEAIYVLAVALIVILFLSRENRSRIACALVVLCMLNSAFGFIVSDVMNVQKGSTKEVMSIPLQQTARYVCKHENEIPVDEKEIINNVVDFNALTTKYVPEKSDNVKNTWKKPTDEELSAYFSLWLEMLQRDPIVYFEAMYNHMYGYFDPFCKSINAMQHQIYIKGPLDSAQEKMSFDTYYSTNSARRIGESYTSMWNRIPVLSMLCFCGIYSWMMFFLISNLIRKRNLRDALIYILPFLTLQICLFSPVNNYSRYFMPIIASMPLFCWFGLRDCLLPRESKKEKPAIESIQVR